MNALLASLCIDPNSYAGPVRVLGGGKRACTHLARMNVNGVPLGLGCIKAFPTTAGNGLFNEIAGFVIARRTGLDVPPGGLIGVPLAVLQSLFPGAAFAADNGIVTCFASAPIADGYGAMATSVFAGLGGNSGLVAKHLMQWDQFARCLAFDQWSGNHDRNDGNLLLGPGARPIPIDHSDCFWGPDFTEGLHDQPKAWTMMKAMWHLPQPDLWPLPLRSQILAECDRWVGVYSAAHSDVSQMREWLPEPCGLRWMHWLWKRAELTRELWAERLGML
jgi:hypothetical protein